MHNFEHYLKDKLLKNVNFQVENKTLKSGKMIVFNIKQFIVKFKLETDKTVLEYELPYPYKIYKEGDDIIFDYSLSAFCPRTEETYWKMLAMDKKKASKIHNQKLKIADVT